MSEYKTRCELHFTTTYTEGILNGTDPVLKDPLIPVMECLLFLLIMDIIIT